MPSQAVAARVVAPRVAELVEFALRAVVGVRQVMAVIETEG